MHLMRRSILWMWVAMIVFVIDRITKILVLGYLFPNQPATIFPFFNLFLTYNTGAAFSFLSGAGGWQNWVFIIIALAISCLIIFKLQQIAYSGRIWLQTSLALILGGAIGNLYDRLTYSMVIDFLDFHVKNWHYPAFNIADSAICIGVIMLLWNMMRCKKAG